MSVELIVNFSLIVALGAMLPGPNGLLIVSNAMIYGRKNAFITLTGTLSAFYVHGFFSVVGISALLMSSTKAFMLIKTVGVAYLLFLGVRSLLQALIGAPAYGVPELAQDKQGKSKSKTWLQGFVTNLLNPKVSMFYLALFPHFVTEAKNLALSTFFLVSLQVVIVGTWFSSVALLADKAQGVGQANFVRGIKAIVGCLMLWFSFKLAVLQAGL